MRLLFRRVQDYVNFDKLGIGLSFLCAVHCVVTPLVILSLPIMARYYLANGWFHFFIALFIIPVGIFAFYSGFRHHRNMWVFVLGIPGLFLIGIVPFLVHQLYLPLNEPLMMVVGSGLLITAHVINRRSCGCAVHHH